MNRKEFLQYSAAGVIIPNLLNGFGVNATASSPWLRLLSDTTVETDHVLVLIRLDGGNDGLNTVIPLDQYDTLALVRPQVLLPENQILGLDGTDTVGFHPSLSGMRDLYNEGKLKVIQSVGYPNQDYSHFRSTDIWMTGANTTEVFSSGWMGRYLNYEYPNYPNGFPNEVMPDPLSIEIGASLSLALQGPSFAMGLSVADPSQFYQLVNGVPSTAPATPAGELLTYVRTVKQQSNAYGQVIVDAFENSNNLAAYPEENVLAEQLKIVARLIAGGLKTRVYLVSISGFDTHDAQVMPEDKTTGEHADLLGVLSGAITAFVRDLEMQGLSDRVTGMTFSEFGRRIISNLSNGTDHGAAAPMFVFGSQVAGGILGDNPFIPPGADAIDNLPMQYDFRSVYTTMLKDWFCIPEADLGGILLHDFQSLPIFNSPDCMPVSTREENQHAGSKLLELWPNPFTESLSIRFSSSGGRTLIQVFNGAGQLVATPANRDFPAGEQRLDWESGELPTGHYYVRIQQGAFQQVKVAAKAK